MGPMVGCMQCFGLLGDGNGFGLQLDFGASEGPLPSRKDLIGLRTPNSATCFLHPPLGLEGFLGLYLCAWDLDGPCAKCCPSSDGKCCAEGANMTRNLLRAFVPRGEYFKSTVRLTNQYSGPCSRR